MVRCLLLLLLSLSSKPAIAQSSADTLKRTTYILPDGRVLPPEKWDSLERAWGKGNINLGHNAEDDAKRIVHLIRVTEADRQKANMLAAQKKQALAAMLNKPAPDFQLKDLQGKLWSLKSLRGKVVVLNFWFTTCAPCIHEMPELNILQKTYQQKEVVFLALTFNNATQVNVFLQRRTFDYTLLPDSQETDKQYHISSWPTSIVIDGKGIIRTIVQSPPTIREDLQKVIDSLL